MQRLRWLLIIAVFTVAISLPSTQLFAQFLPPPTLVTPSAPNPATTNTTPQASNPSTVNTSPSGTFSLQNPLQYTTVGGLVNGFLQIFSYVAVLFAVLMLIWVGLQFVLARGNPERMNVLKSWLLWIVIGAAIVIGARIIVSVVINTLGATGAVNQNIINSANNGLNQQ